MDIICPPLVERRQRFAGSREQKQAQRAASHTHKVDVCPFPIWVSTAPLARLASRSPSESLPSLAPRHTVHSHPLDVYYCIIHVFSMSLLFIQGQRLFNILILHQPRRWRRIAVPHPLKHNSCIPLRPSVPTATQCIRLTAINRELKYRADLELQWRFLQKKVDRPANSSSAVQKHSRVRLT